MATALRPCDCMHSRLDVGERWGEQRGGEELAGDMRRKRGGVARTRNMREQGGCELSHPRNIFHEINNLSQDLLHIRNKRESANIHDLKKRNCELTVHISRACEDGCELIVLFLL